MLKVAIFDGGWGGELFTKYVEEELSVVEVTKVIDWRHGPYGGLEWEEICQRTEEAVRPYVGEVDVIVLASYEATVAAIDYLKRTYPEQKFLGFEPRLMGLLPNRAETPKIRRVVMAGSDAVRRSVGYKIERAQLGLEYEILEVDTLGWSRLISKDSLTDEALKLDLERQGIEGLGHLGEKEIDAILLYATEMADQQERLERVIGWQVFVATDFKRALQELNVLLGLKQAIGGSRRWRS